MVTRWCHRGRGRRSVAAGASLLVVAGTLVAAPAPPAAADTTPQPLPLTQSWSTDAAIPADDDWSAVPGLIGYRGDNMTTATGVNPLTVLAEGSAVVDVNANQTNPDTFTAGGVAEFRITDPVVALQGSGTADAPHLVATFSTTGVTGIRVHFVARDIDSASDVVQPLALQFRVGTSGDYANVPDGFVADATATGATVSTTIDVPLPAAADDRPVVQIRILTTDAPGSDEWVGIDDLAITSTGVISGPAVPVATCPSTLASFVDRPTSAPVSATDADSAFASVAITSAAVDGIDLTPGADASTATLTVAGSTTPGAYLVAVTFTTDDPTPQTASCDIAVTVAGVTPIHTVQGTGAISLMVGQQVLVEGIVTATITRGDRLDGFFVQAPDDAADSDPTTSEGVYVFCSTSCPPSGVSPGNAVQAVGRVAEFDTQPSAADDVTTEIITGPGGIDVADGIHPLPTAIPIELPAAAPTSSAATFERYEGMLTTVPATLTVSELFQQAQFGELELMAGGRPYTFTQLATPTKAGNADHLAALSLRRLVLDDASDDTNDPIVGDADEPYFFPTPGLSAGNRVRAGDTIAGLTGVMQWAFDQWRLRPVAERDYTFSPTNVWPSTAPKVAGRLRLAGFNVLNYFATIDTTASTTSGPCAPSGTQDCRGADSEAERVAQLAKIVASLKDIDADVVGLTEIENDTGLATEQIVTSLNAATAPGTYAFVDTDTIGTDAIKVAFLYKPATVTPVGATRILTSAIDPRFIDVRNRPPIIQTFKEMATGEVFTAAINHLKSKGSDCVGDAGLPDDPDIADGAGNCNLTRTAAAQAEIEFLATDPTGSKDPDVIVLGDLNAYRMEDPITTFERAGYTNLVHRYVGAGAYSFLFDGMIGYLDHALANPSMTTQVVDADEWHSNADESPLFDYSDEFADAGERSFERKSAALPLLVPDPRRASDHDPVIVGIDLASLRVDAALVAQAPRGGGTIVASGSAGVLLTSCPTLELTVGGTNVKVGPTTRVARTNTCVSLTTNGVITYDVSTGRFAAALALPGFRLPNSDQLTIGLTVNGTSHAVVRDGRRTGLIWVAT